MNTIRGAIESIKSGKTSKGRDRYEIMLNGNRLSKLGICPFIKGDLVEADYELKNGFMNIITIRRSLAGSPILPAPQGIETPKLKMHVEADAGLPSPKDTSIVRQSCIRSASMKNAGKNTTGNEDVELARIYEKYVEEG